MTIMALTRGMWSNDWQVNLLWQICRLGLAVI